MVTRFKSEARVLDKAPKGFVLEKTFSGEILYSNLINTMPHGKTIYIYDKPVEFIACVRLDSLSDFVNLYHMVYKMSKFNG